MEETLSENRFWLAFTSVVGIGLLTLCLVGGHLGCEANNTERAQLYADEVDARATHLKCMSACFETRTKALECKAACR